MLEQIAAVLLTVIQLLLALLGFPVRFATAENQLSLRFCKWPQRRWRVAAQLLPITYKDSRFHCSLIPASKAHCKTVIRCAVRLFPYWLHHQSEA